MLDKQICKQCHNNSLEATSENKAPLELTNWIWEEEGERLWAKGKIECPSSRTGSGVHVYNIHENIPNVCPFSTEHIVNT